MRPVLCMVTDRRRWASAEDDGSRALVDRAAAAARAGLHLVQVRERDLDGGPLVALTGACMHAVRGSQSRIVVNDRLDVALAAGAHGVHLRSDSMPAAPVRRQCPRPFLIGRSIHSVEEAAAADPAVLDYLIFGTVFATESKPGRAPAGLDALAAVVRSTTVPVLAIGGITASRLPEVMATGAAGVAAMSMDLTRQ